MSSAGKEPEGGAADGGHIPTETLAVDSGPIESSEGAWPEVHVPVPESSDAIQHELAVEQIEDWLLTAGALAVTLLDSDNAPAESGAAVLEPAPGETRLWRRVTIVGLYPQGQDVQSLTEQLSEAVSTSGLDAMPAWTLVGLPDAVWERQWLRDFGPMRFGPRFCVVPTAHDSNLESEPGAGSAMPDDQLDVMLRLDPGLAFGTGTHPTTALCLAWLGSTTDKTRSPFAGLDVIDYGCGSGILAIAALLLGAARVDAVDIDPQALTASRENARINGVLERMRIGTPDMLDERVTKPEPELCDVLLANILHGPLLELGERLASLTKPGGRVVLSGLLEAQSESLHLSYTPWFEFEPDVMRDGWVVLTAIRRA